MKQGRGVRRGKTGYRNMDHMDKTLLAPIQTLCNIKITKYFIYKPRLKEIFQKIVWLE